MPNYWIHTVQYDSWKKINQTNDVRFLSSYMRYDIYKKDLILIYRIGNRKKSGFIGVATVLRDMRNNIEHIKVHRDNNLNRYIIKLDNIDIFDDVVSVKHIFKQLKDDNEKGYANTKSFVNCFTKNEFNDIDNNKGKTIVESLYKIYPEIREGGCKNSDSEQINDQYYSDENEEFEKSNEEFEESNEEFEESNEEFEESDEEFEESDEEFEESDEECNNIPIMMTLCNKYKNTASKKSFLKHYRKCTNCSIFNNNNIDIGHDFTKRKITFTNINDDDEELPIALEAYYNLKDYIPNAPAPYIEVAYIEDHDIYDHCCIILFNLDKN